MNKEFVPEEQALALKELGFDEPCFGYYNIDPQLKNPAFNMVKPFEHIWCLPAPLYQQAFRWFREKHGLYYYILPEFYKNGINFNWQILWYLPKEEWTNYRIYNGTMLYGDNGEYPTQEEADIACLKKLIEIVKENKQ